MSIQQWAAGGAAMKALSTAPTTSLINTYSTVSKWDGLVGKVSANRWQLEFYACDLLGKNGTTPARGALMFIHAVCTCPCNIHKLGNRYQQQVKPTQFSTSAISAPLERKLKLSYWVSPRWREEDMTQLRPALLHPARLPTLGVTTGGRTQHRERLKGTYFTLVLVQMIYSISSE